MEALNAVGLSPLSVLSKPLEPRKKLSPVTISQFKCQSVRNSDRVFSVSRSLSGGLLLLSSVLASESAKALTSDELLESSTSIINSIKSSLTTDIDVSGGIDSVVSFAAENPIIVGGGAAVLAVPLLVSQLLSQSKPWGVVSAKNAYAKLGEDSDAQLLDIRSAADIKQVGTPDLQGLKKKPVKIVYRGEDKPGFLKKLSLKFKKPENTILFILDKFNGNSELVAELVTANGFKAAYAIRDGVEGSAGWKSSGLPWTLPSKGLIDLSNLTDALGEASDAAPVTLGIAAAAAGLGLLAFTEVETVLQVLGTAALVQFVSKKLLFAEERKQTIQQLEELLNAKVVPKELADDIQQIGKALLPSVTSTKALPAAAEANLALSDSAVQKSESIPETSPSSEVNSVPKEEIQEESLPGLQRPLSPYPNYPDYKPPSSPIPSQP